VRTRPRRPHTRKLLGFTDNRQDAALQSGHFNDFLFVSLIRAGFLGALEKAGDQGLRSDELGVAQQRALGFDRPSSRDSRRVAARANLKGFNLQEAESTLRQVLSYRVWFDQRRGWRYTNPNLEQLGWSRSTTSVSTRSPPTSGVRDGAGRTSHALPPRAGRSTASSRPPAQVDGDPQPGPRADRLSSRSSQRSHSRFARLGASASTRSRVGRAGSWSRRPRARTLSARRGPHRARWFAQRARQAAARVENRPAAAALGRHDGRARPQVQGLRRAHRGAPRAACVHGLVSEENTPFGDQTGWRLNDACVLFKRGTACGRSDPRTRTPSSATSTPTSRHAAHPGAPALRLRGPRAHRPGRWREARRAREALSLRREGARGAGRRREAPPRDRGGEPVPPVLFCSPTMELGVDISALNAVYLRNVPPTPANYAQRSGRAGRSGQAALVLTYSSSQSPHDQYFFRDPKAMVHGEVRPPLLDLANRDLVESHLSAVWLACTEKPSIRRSPSCSCSPRPRAPAQARRSGAHALPKGRTRQAAHPPRARPARGRSHPRAGALVPRPR
jgi:hypothetical protein